LTGMFLLLEANLTGMFLLLEANLTGMFVCDSYCVCHIVLIINLLFHDLNWFLKG
jgi:hypothetical protein